MQHRLTIQPWGTGIRVQCTCRARSIYHTSLPSTDFQTVIDAAVRHMDENFPLHVVQAAPACTCDGPRSGLGHSRYCDACPA